MTTALTCASVVRRERRNADRRNRCEKPKRLRRLVGASRTAGSAIPRTGVCEPSGKGLRRSRLLQWIRSGCSRSSTLAPRPLQGAPQHSPARTPVASPAMVYAVIEQATRRRASRRTARSVDGSAVTKPAREPTTADDPSAYGRDQAGELADRAKGGGCERRPCVARGCRGRPSAGGSREPTASRQKEEKEALSRGRWPSVFPRSGTKTGRVRSAAKRPCPQGRTDRSGPCDEMRPARIRNRGRTVEPEWRERMRAVAGARWNAPAPWPRSCWCRTHPCGGSARRCVRWADDQLDAHRPTRALHLAIWRPHRAYLRNPKPARRRSPRAR